MARPSTPLISRRIAVEAALDLIDDEGYEQFSLERLARRLGVKSPSLYHHFANRSDLLTSTAFHLLSGIEVPEPVADGAWHQWFVDLGTQLHRQVMAHPRAAGLIFTYFPEELTRDAHETGMTILARQGFPADTTWGVMRGLEKLIFGLALADANDLVESRQHLPENPHRWPVLVEGIESCTDEPEQLLASAVESYLVGVTTRYAGRAGRKTRSVAGV